MKTTTFYKKDGNVSSRRHTLKVGKNSISFSDYGGNRGGVTFKSGATTTRFNKNNQCIGFGLSTGRSTTYYGTKFRPMSNLTTY